MSNLFGTTSKSNYWVWIYVIAGVILIIIHPSNWLGWVPLNLVLLEVIFVLMIVPHELGHAIAARLVGLKVIKIVIGSGKILFTTKFLDMLWEIKRFPVGGVTSFSGKSTYFYRSRVFFIILCGPLTNLFSIFLLSQFPQEIILKNLPGTYLFPGIVFYTANLLIIVENLFPHHAAIDGMKIPSDGLQMLTIPFLSEQEIAQRVALAYVQDGLDWQRRGNHEQAIESFNEAIQKDSVCVQAYQSRGTAYQGMGNYQKAIEDLDRALELEPQNEISYFLRGFVYFEWRKLDSTKLQDAIEDLNQAIHIQPNEFSYYAFRAMSHCYLGHDIQAIEDFTKVIQLNPTAGSYYNRGVTYYQYENYQAALEDFNQAIKIDNKMASAYYGRGNTRYELQDQPGAFQDYSKAKALSSSITIDKKDEHGFYIRGIAYVHLGDKVEAMKEFQIAEALCLEKANVKLLQQIRGEMKKIADKY